MNLHCQSCIHWSFSYDNGFQKFGKCNNQSVENDIRIATTDDEPDIFTEACFGCVWHQVNNKIVFEIKPYQKDT